MSEVVAITTKYLGPTDTRGPRIRASTSLGQSVMISFPYELSGEAVHRKAAEALCAKLGWTGRMVGGGIKGGYVFVFVEE